MKAEPATPAMDVVVCYKREDGARLAPIVDGLRSAGLRVWWDRDIPGGANWRQTLLDRLDSANCVIVVWSEGSVGAAGGFVREEASRAQSRHVLLPLRIDDVTAPLGYGELQTLDFTNWTGRLDDPGFLALVDSIKTLIAGVPRDETAYSRAPVRSTTAASDRSILFVRGYLADLLELTSGPKRFLAQRLADRGDAVNDALRFLVVSFVLTWALKIPLARANLLYEFVTDASFLSVSVLLLGATVYVAWRLVGAASPIDLFFMIHLYLYSVLMIVHTLVYIVARGVLRSDRPLFDKVMEGAASGEVRWFLGAPELFAHEAALNRSFRRRG